MLGLFRKAAAQGGPAGGGEALELATYAQWSECLDRLARGDDDEQCLARMARGQLAWGTGVGPLFVKRLSEELQRRLTACADRMTRDLRSSAAEAQVVRAVLQARGQLFFLHRLCQLPALPETARSQLADEVKRFAERSQQSLLDSALADRSGRLASVLRNNPLTRYDAPGPDPKDAAPATAALQPPATPPSASGDMPVRRRNILS